MRTIAQIGEVGLIQRIRRRIHDPASVRVGIGDDAAVLRLPAPRHLAGQAGWTVKTHLLFASDMLIEGVHFRRREMPRWIGWKALACNISDVAAMGGRPQYAVVSLGLPRTTPLRVVDELYRGLNACAKRFGVAIVGGDTVRAPCLVIDVAILGIAEASRLVLRRGAKVGDRLFVTGRLGGSLISQRHARFTPRLHEAQSLLRQVPIHAMLDLSDGLAVDLWNLARASRVAIRIEERAIPVARAARTSWHALMDGEDFELLFAVPRRAVRRVPRAIGRCPVTEIGTVIGRGARVLLRHRDGRIKQLVPQGFRHF